MLYVREIAEKFLSTLLLMFIFYVTLIILIKIQPVETAAEKAFDFAIQMTLDHVLVQRCKKKEMDEKSNF